MKQISTAALLFLMVVLVASCSNDPAPPRSLLLGTNDFPGQGLTEVARKNGETSPGETSPDGPAVQVELTSPDFTLLESLVLFETAVLAHTVLSGIKQDQIAQGVTPQPVEGFEDNTGVMDERFGGEDGSTVFFVQGPALMRITLTGAGHAEKIWEIAALAREKSRK